MGVYWGCVNPLGRGRRALSLPAVRSARLLAHFTSRLLAIHPGQRQTKRQRDRQRDREKDRETERPTVRETNLNPSLTHRILDLLDLSLTLLVAPAQARVRAQPNRY